MHGLTERRWRISRWSVRSKNNKHSDIALGRLVCRHSSSSLSRSAGRAKTPAGLAAEALYQYIDGELSRHEPLPGRLVSLLGVRRTASPAHYFSLQSLHRSGAGYASSAHTALVDHDRSSSAHKRSSTMLGRPRCSGLLVMLQALWCLAQACKELYLGVFSTLDRGGCALLPLTSGFAFPLPYWAMVLCLLVLWVWP